MKKVKVTLRMGSSGKKLYLFPSSEALYVWTCAMEKNELVEVPGLEELVIEPGCFIEAELRGFEYVYEDDGKFRRFNLVRLGRATQPSNGGGLLVTVHTGWVTGGLLPMKRYVDSDIDVRQLNVGEGRLDLAALFKDEQLDEDVDVNLDDDEPEDP